MNRTVQWGILGTGDIARQMAGDLRLVPQAQLRAVASRSPRRAELFGETHDIPNRYGTYQDLVSDPHIDVVYVATPHPRHCADTLLCLEHDKAVLCEKPLAMNCRQADAMIAMAKRRGCFLMEALWTAFFPAIEAMRQDLDKGKIGCPNLVVANFAYQADPSPEGRLFNRSLGGGALLDIGVYTIALADMVFGKEPETVHTAWTTATTGVDESETIVLDYGGGQRAILSASLSHNAPQEATITGDRGTIRIPHRFSQPDSYTIVVDGHATDHTFTREGFGYHHEARSVTACVQAKQGACSTVPWAMSQRILRTTDRIRAQWGLQYAGEQGIL